MPKARYTMARYGRFNRAARLFLMPEAMVNMLLVDAEA